MNQSGPTGETLNYTQLAQKYGFSPDTFFGHTGFIGLDDYFGPTGFYYQIHGVTGTYFYFINVLIHILMKNTVKIKIGLV